MLFAIEIRSYFLKEENQLIKFAIIPREILKALFILLILAVAFPDSLLASGPTPCQKKQKTWDCLRNNFKEVYMGNYDLWGDIILTREKKAEACESLAITADYLEVVSSHADGEIGEMLAETIGRLAVDLPECLLDSILLMKKKS
jgi:hypothetical protein